MKLLFLIEAALDPCGASHTLGRRLCGALAAQGHQVTILESRGAGGGEYPFPEGVAREFFDGADEKTLIDTILNWRSMGVSWPKTVLLLLGKPRLWPVAIPWMLGFRPLQQAYQRQTEKLCHRQSFDWAVAVGAPQYPAFALARAHIPCRKAVYWMDPFSEGSMNRDFLRTRQESALYQKSDAIFVTDAMYKKAKTNHFKEWVDKMLPLSFPNLVPVNIAPRRPAEASKGLINCVYAGRFVAGLRPPQPLVELFRRLPTELFLTLVGDNAYNPGQPPLSSFQRELPGRLAITGFVPVDQAFSYMCGADVLIHLGNADPDRLPSKLFDYLSLGKPILHISRTAACPAAALLQRYPLSFQVAEGDLSPETLEGIAVFCNEVRGKTMPFEQVAQLYPNHLSSAVAADFTGFLARQEAHLCG